MKYNPESGALVQSNSCLNRVFHGFCKCFSGKAPTGQKALYQQGVREPETPTCIRKKGDFPSFFHG